MHFIDKKKIMTLFLKKFTIKHNSASFSKINLMPGSVPESIVALNSAKNTEILAAQIIGSSDKIVLDKIITYKEGLKQAAMKASEGIINKNRKSQTFSQFGTSTHN